MALPLGKIISAGVAAVVDLGLEWSGGGASVGRAGRFQGEGAVGSASPVDFLFSHVFCVV
jgi:hypothetical protein